MDQSHIDALLERYLALVHEYTQLRNRLSTLQAGVFHNIARANFAAERGLRYGQDQYDDRMQALRTLEIRAADKTDSDAAPSFHVFDAATRVAERGEGAEPSGDDNKPSMDETETTDSPEAEDAKQGKENKPEKKTDSFGAKTVDTRNPLRWFGVLVPQPLRNAQNLSIEAAEQVIPRLVSVDAEMQRLEIEVRRARKKRSKAERAATKSDKAGGANAGIGSIETAVPVLSG
jgi:coiled-coil domain-containing protein 115